VWFAAEFNAVRPARTPAAIRSELHAVPHPMTHCPMARVSVLHVPHDAANTDGGDDVGGAGHGGRRDGAKWGRRGGRRESGGA